jgi:hypothetical protein
MKSHFTLFCFPTWPVMMDGAKRIAWNKASITKNDAGSDDLKGFSRCSASQVMALCQSFLSGWKARVRTPEITIVFGLGTCLALFARASRPQSRQFAPGLKPPFPGKCAQHKAARTGLIAKQRLKDPR